MLAGTFAEAFMRAGAVDTDGKTPSRPPVSRSLHDELRAIATRAGALNAIVIDANSPIVWGAARPQGLAVGHELPSGPRLADAAEALSVDLMEDYEAKAHDPPTHADARIPSASRRAIHDVRQLPAIAALRKGRHLRHVERGTDLGWTAHSFAGIYVLLAVYGGTFEELRAERTIVDALARVERPRSHCERRRSASAAPPLIASNSTARRRWQAPPSRIKFRARADRRLRSRRA
jgi:hypothetical protein